LIFGHTHKFFFQQGKIALLNPGSATGAESGGSVEPIPSMCIWGEGKLTHYRLENSELKKEVFDL
ncbi:MAG: hypothetical protein ABIH99_02210, partial [Candidatus Micrarchaeota archaeon]